MLPLLGTECPSVQTISDSKQTGYQERRDCPHLLMVTPRPFGFPIHVDPAWG